jgi:hypothetical protein
VDRERRKQVGAMIEIRTGLFAGYYTSDTDDDGSEN